MLLADTLLAALVTAGILMLVFKTTAIEEYASLLKLEGWLGIPRWKQEIPPPSCKSAPPHYMAWARTQALAQPPGFRRWLLMLVTCPFCLGLWLAVAASIALVHPWPTALICVPATYSAAVAIFRRLL